MAIYFIFFIWILLFAIFPSWQKNKAARSILFVCLGLFLCTGYMVGSDWRSYEYYYGKSDPDIKLEIGYYYITQILSWIGVQFWHFYILTKLFCYYTIIKFIQKYTKGHFAWALLFFYSYLSLYYFIDCPFRNLIAASVFLYAIDSLVNKKTKLFILYTLIAASFHLSVLFFAPLFYLLTLRKSAINKNVFVFLSIGIYILFAFLIQIDQLTSIQVFLEMILGDVKNLNYLLQQGANFSIGMVVITVFYWLVVYSIDTSILNNREAQFFNSSILYYVFYISMYFIPMMNRLSLYAFLPFICTLTLGINSLLHRNKLIAIVAVVLFTLFLGNAIRNNVTKDYRFVPYSSYLEYIGRDKPSYQERDSYNMTHSPYKNNGDNVFEYRN